MSSFLLLIKGEKLSVFIYVSHDKIVLVFDNILLLLAEFYVLFFLLSQRLLDDHIKILKKKHIKIQQGKNVMIGWSHIVCKSPYLFHDDQELASCFTDDGGCADPSVYQRDFLKYLRYNLLAYQTTLPESKTLSQKKKYSNTVYRYT